MSFLNPSPTRVGLVCLARQTFDVDFAAQWYARAQTVIGSLNDVKLHVLEKQVIEPVDAEAAIEDLESSEIDALIIVSGTFALGGLSIRLAQAFDEKPIMLWAWPEPREHDGTLRLNSLVGTMVNASNLHKLGYRPVSLYAAVDDPETTASIRHFTTVAGLLRDLKKLRIALIGGHAAGFDNLSVNKIALDHSLGIEVVDVDLQTIINYARNISLEDARVTAADIIESFDDTSEVTDTQSIKLASLVIALRGFAEINKYDGLALKCWGDLVDWYGIAGCGAITLLNDGNLVAGCEGDVMGTITMLIAQRLTGVPSCMADLINIDREANIAKLWHIGCAPLCLADPDQPKHLFSHFAGGKGVTSSFSLKPGRVTVFRLGDDGCNLRMIATTGYALKKELDMRGTVSLVTLDSSVEEFLNRILLEGWEHHIIMAYGDIILELDMLCRALQIPLTIMQ